jgi:lactoylglutathione lyase
LHAVEVITIFAEDLPATKAFYTDVFGLPLVFEDAVSAVFKFDDLLLNVPRVSEVPKLVEPAPVGATGRARATCQPSGYLTRTKPPPSSRGTAWRC